MILFRRRVIAVALAASLTGCVVIPPDAFKVSPEMLAQRQIESRRFAGIAEEDVLVASSNVLQDMGFNLENSEVKLGVLTANKQRDATSAGEIVGAVVLAVLFGVAAPVSKSQSIRVSLVVQPAGKESAIAQSYAGASAPTPEAAIDKAVSALPTKVATQVSDAINTPGAYVVRATFQRIVTRTDNSVYVESIKDPELYQDFFDKLSKSIFIEAQKL